MTKIFSTFIILVSLLFALSVGGSQTPWWNDAVFYEIFVRSFQDSNGDGIGDLNGITSRLAYLKSLGVTGIWLTPIFKSPSYHGYDATDYKSINPEYGTLEDFKRLMTAAHQRGIRVILDIAVNHTSSQHPWFIQAASNPRSPDRERYVWSSTDPEWPGHHWHPLGDEFYYSFFGPKMPDLNWLDPPVMQSVKDILTYWAGLGVDGFRLDAARYYIEGPHGEPDTRGTHEAIQEFGQYVRQQFPGRFFVGEIWADGNIISSYVNTKTQLDLAFNFPLSFGLLNSLKNQNANAFSGALNGSYRLVNPQTTLAPFITNHDMIRISTDLAGNKAKLSLAASALFTLPGTPFIYYGEEIGLPNRPSSGKEVDQDKRTPMEWTSDAQHGFTTSGREPWWPFSSDDPNISVATQIRQPASLLNEYRALIHLRQQENIFRHGILQPVAASDNRVSAYIRVTDREMGLVILNFSAEAIPSIQLSLPRNSANPYRTASLWGGSKFNVNATSQRFNVTVSELRPLSTSILKIIY